MERQTSFVKSPLEAKRAAGPYQPVIFPVNF